MSKSIVVIVAHPDDETLWAGGTILSHPSNKWFIVCLCRASDKDRSVKFNNTLKLLNSEGIMGDLDDGPTQEPIDEKVLEDYILKLLPSRHFDLIITHNSTGEYTRHLRHEEVNKAVITLWHNGKISANELWTFAYEDGNKTYFPRAIDKANIYEVLPENIWLEKYKIITETYGFEKHSWEAETTPQAEAFYQFKDANYAKKSIVKTENELNIFKTLNIDSLKSKYHKSKAFANDKINREKETSLIKASFILLNKNLRIKKTIYRIGCKLRITNLPGIESLKLLYSKTRKLMDVTQLFNEQPGSI